MISRYIYKTVQEALNRQAAVALIGPRQVGKTTLAFEVAQGRPAIYLDLEERSDREKLAEPLLFLNHYPDKLIILDEIHRVPEIFQTLRGVIDQGRRQGNKNGRFLLLGSASIELLRQSSETLAGRISYVDMTPFNTLEITDDPTSLMNLWIRGGFPDSYLTESDEESFEWRKDFIRTYLERDIPMFGPRIPAENIERLWTMLAHSQGSILNASKLAAGLSISAQTVTRYIDLLTDLLLVRRLQPYHLNLSKRLVKSPKVYIRDSGIAHALLNLKDYNDLSGHPAVGMSWEGFVIENILAAAPKRTRAGYYRTSAGAEVDLLLELPGGELWAIEIKKALAPKLEKGFYIACEDIKPNQLFTVYPGQARYPISKNIEAISLPEITKLLAQK